MARRPFGGGPADVVMDSKGNTRPLVTGTAWTAQTGGTQVTDLQSTDGTALPAGVITAGTHGEVQFLGPADDTGMLWLDFGSGRQLAVATDVVSRLAALTSSSSSDLDAVEAAAAAALAAETSARTAADAAEQAARLAEDADDESRDAAEEAARIAAVAAEASARAAAVAAEASARADAVTAEAAARSAADSALQASITANTSALALKAPLASPALTGTPTVDGQPVETTTHAAGTYLTVVAHGATAGTTRPDGAARVLWVGTVEPSNGTAADLYLDSATPALYSLVGAVWTALGGGGGLTTEQLQDLVGAMVSGGTETGITVTYDDTNGRLDFVVTGAPIPSADAVRWVSGAGDDANDGLSQAAPKRTLQAAYTALPSTGGTLFVAPGRYDMGAGWDLTRGKPVSVVGLVKPPPYIASTTTAPLTVNAAIIYTSTNAASLITTLAGTAATKMNGLRFENLLFEMSGTSTAIALDLTSCNYGEVTGCYFFSDKTTGPSPVTVQGMYVRASSSYGDNDSSWWRVWNNRCMNAALGTFGNATGTKLSCNQQVITGNVGLGLSRLTTTTLPFISIYGGHRCVVRDNNIEAYYRGVLMDTCFMCTEDGDGGEYVDFFVDLVNTKGCKISPQGISYAGLGNNSATTPYVQDAKLVRGDSSTKANILILPSTWTAANTQRLYQPTDDSAHPSIVMSSTDNVIISSRNSTQQGALWPPAVGSGSPEGVVTAIIGSAYISTGGGASTTLYIKESGTGNTGWVAYGAPGGGGGSSTVSVVARTTDSTISASTTLTADSTLKFAIGATEMWFFEGFLLVNAANTTMDMKIGLSGPASFTASWGNGDVAGASVNPGFPSVAAASTPLAPLGAAGVVTLGTPAANLVMVHVAGWVTGGGTAGDVALTFAQNTSDAGNLLIKKGSHLKYYRVAT